MSVINFDLVKTMQEFPDRVLVARGLSDLPTAERDNIRGSIEDLLFQHLLNSLLGYISEEELAEIVTNLETDNPAEFFSALFIHLPDTPTILVEEIELFFQELTSNIAK